MSNSTKDQAKTCHCIDRDVHCLTYEQVERLYSVVSEPVQIYPKEGNFPILSIPPSTLVKLVLTKLDNRGINVRDVRLNGSGASFCLAEEREKEPKPHYNDLDIIFRIDTKSEHDLNTIKDEVLSTLFEFFPEGTQTGRISSFMLEEYYVKKRVKVSSNSDRWSLISLGDDNGKNIELKFVSSMKRQYEFSIDSFQIILDPLLHCSIEETNSISSSNNTVSLSTPKFLPDSFPQIQAISLYDDFNKALHHLNNRLIATNNPEEIRGGGLLKYCYLLVNGYQASDHQEMEAHEPYMCSRFFIDFPHMNLQFTKIHKYIYTRFLQPGVPEKGLEFLEALLCIIMNKAKCLMESERYKSMRVLQQLQVNLLWQYGSPLYKFQMYPPHSPAHNQPFCFPMPPHNSTQSSSSYSNRAGNNATQTNSHSVSSSCVSTTSQPFINFPHTHNNAVPIGPTPTPVR